MRFTPKTEAAVQAEASKFGPWPNGIYDFEVSEAEDRTSSAGNDMIDLTLLVFNEDGDRRTVFDYLLEAIPHKLRHAAYACGLDTAYEAGIMTADDFYGKTGRVKLGIQPAKDGYPTKNTVRDYLVAPATPRPAASPPKKPAMATADLDDDIPF